jgi:hypothetical protein
MAEWDDKPWTAPARSLVLYCPKGQWRFAIYNEAGVVDGVLSDLSATVSPDEAQAVLLNRVQEDTGLTYLATWRQDKPDWWSADLVARD